MCRDKNHITYIGLVFTISIIIIFTSHSYICALFILLNMQYLYYYIGYRHFLILTPRDQ
ncbi:hypothetical protein C2G38_2109011 [Gigaspora rosea]|uniref:Uncharacterized protein n=1 Tax=Gigaspora rosea TaxID=44941 RepID=A0A397UGH7_9GLOM|nr:hypothetical protein C2G38_2109011 [Gigaspora rosea]